MSSSYVHGDPRRTVAAQDRLLAETSLALDTALGVDERLRAVVGLLTSQLADLCMLYLIHGGALELAASAHVDPAALADLRALPGPSARVRRVAGSGRSELRERVDEAAVREWLEDEADPPRRLRVAPRSFCAVPIAVRGSTIGVIALGRGADRSPFRAGDVPLVEELGRRVGLAVDNARLYERARESARVEAARAQALSDLQTLTAALSEALTPSAVALALIDIGLPLLGAEAGGLTMLDDDGRMLRSVHLDGYPARAMARTWVFPLSAATPLSDAVRIDELQYARSSDAAVARWPSMAGFRAGHGREGALAAVPISVAGRPVGAMAVRYAQAGPLGDESRRLLETVSRLAGAALLRASHYQREHTVAETLQRSLLPRRLPQPEGTTIGAGYAAAGEGIEAGGDWYDAIELDEGHLALMVGDVVGRGPRAAAVMGQLRSALRAFASDRRDGPGEVMANLSRFATAIEGAHVATAAYAVIDIARRRMRYVCAGHPAPLLLRADGSTRYLEGGRGIPLAVRDDVVYEEGEVGLPAGSTLLLYTDGLIERRGVSIDYGLARLARAVGRRGAEGPAALTEGLLDELGGSGDDCAVLAFRLDGVVADLRFEGPAKPEHLSTARSALRDWLARAGLPREEADDVILASGEALANSVEHGYRAGAAGTVRMYGSVREKHVLELHVSDDGHWRTPPADAGDRGRGLAIMRTVMDRVEVNWGPAGTTVSMRRRVAPPGAASGIEQPPVAVAGPAAGAWDPDATLVLAGEIDAANIQRTMGPLLAPGTTVRSLDLRAVTFFGSTALQGLFTAARGIREAGGDLHVVAPAGSVAARVLDISDARAVCSIEEGPAA